MSGLVRLRDGKLAGLRILVPVRGTLVAVLLFAACAAIEAPPLEIMQRDSLLGIGKILIVTNPSEQALEEVTLRFENPNGDTKNYTLGSLNTGAETEVGWKKLDGFEVSDAAKVEVRAKGYGRALILDLGR